ncbi:MAG TPA: ATP-binding protein [Methylomirabilota bacterium]|nr:ATP-binding protein [Methylomirabilota bacterium]
MAETWTLERIQALVDAKVEESTSLEYKSHRALGPSPSSKDELVKDVTAMANAAGGSIIYGVEEDPEKRHLPGKIIPAQRSVISKEWIESVLASVSPKLDGLSITPITYQDDEHALYVVTVQQSVRAHQAKDLKYYKRRNFRVDPMEDYEIRDINARGDHPIVTVQFELEVKTREIEGYEHDVIGLAYIMSNEGRKLAKYVMLHMHLPFAAMSETLVANYDVRTVGGKRIYDIVARNKPPAPEAQFTPILPNSLIRFPALPIKSLMALKAADELTAIIQADNAPERARTLKFSDIRLFDRRPEDRKALPLPPADLDQDTFLL